MGQSDVRTYRDWLLVGIAGAFGFAAMLGVMDVINQNSAPLSTWAVAFACVSGALSGMLIVSGVLAARVRQKLREKNGLLVGNERYRTMYNIAPDGLSYGMSLRDVLMARAAAGTFSPDPDRYISELNDLIGGGKPLTMTTTRGDGRVVALVNQPTAGGGFVATHEDITARTQVERALAHTHAFLDSIIENVPTPIMVKDIKSLRYLLTNRAAEAYLGVDRSAILGKTADDVMPAATAAFISAEDRRLIADGKAGFFDARAVVTPRNGTRVGTSTRMAVTGPAGTPGYLISLINDVTERKRDEQRLAHM